MFVRLFVVMLCASLGFGARADAISADDSTHHATEPPAHAPASADGHHHREGAPAGGHAPIGVMGDHMHDAGEVMLSYRFMYMDMDGNRDGASRESTASVLRSFPVTPTGMDMEMHMIGAMYAPIHELTLMLMVPIVRLEMDHRTRMGAKFTTKTDGLGDIRLTGLVRLYDDETHHLHLNLGLSFPTGSIREKDDTPMGRVRLPYPMQLGSGTWDLYPGLTYTGRADAWSWGAQSVGTIRTGNNDEGYRLGNRYQVTAWGARDWTPWVSTSLRLAFGDWKNIRGDDDSLNPQVVPTADPDLRAGRRLDLLVGMNFIVPDGPLRGNRFAVEFGYPVWQHLRGPQLETDWLLTAGWQYAF